MMSRKDYQMIADRLAGELAIRADVPGEWHTMRCAIYALADGFKQDNPRFDRERFYRACGLNVEQYHAITD